MKRLLLALGCATVLISAPVAAQSNNDDFTPLNSRIKRKNQFPLEPRKTFDLKKMSQVNKDRSKAMMGQFTRCLYNRSNEKSLDLLQKTDLGFRDFKQIGTDTEKAMRVFGFSDCLRRVASTNNSGVSLHFYSAGVRQWLLQEAYFDRYPAEASWVMPGNVIGERTFPLSEGDAYVSTVLELADCVVSQDPYNADFYFRTPAGSEDEKQAINELMPSLSGCIPEGRQLQIDPSSLRIWLGEALWHASNNSAPAEADSSEVNQ
ncbi:hypothetical protein SZ64_05010 [Erythrobacter sp. SG61-1L]|uniref:hypothetical protein n=1 Tax=Erythrobacter sp. SG61-1L TaxID=1603897 RepID=UPI0006C91EDC|nr:hypothetical protein [Erythrobacter sp. SG61-1L]KPL67522.1 hypothetical protein SZ64_05010 [Erythrobacter sp. SG61-1L]